MSSLVLSSRDEDKIGLVQLNQHLQKTLTIFLGIHLNPIFISVDLFE